MKVVSMYLAGGLFNVAERVHNVTLETHLIATAKEEGIDLRTTLPQRTAMKRFVAKEGRFDIARIVADCEVDAASHNYILCNLDGTDTDSGTAVELGIARGQKLAYERATNPEGIIVPKIITYRTDSRTAIKNEVGVNAMLTPDDSTFIYHPCFAIESADIEIYYKELASKIIEVIKRNID